MRNVLVLAVTSTIVACGARSSLTGFGSSGASTSGGAGGSGTSTVSSSGSGSAAGDCPAPEMPSLASPCMVPGQVCTYERGKMGPCSDASSFGTVAWRCEDGRWLEIAHCVDRSACPADAPADGDACDAAGLDCFYDAPGCSAAGIVQCDGAEWRRVNGCPERAASPCALAPVIGSALEPALVSPTQNVEFPSLALAGTQILLAGLVNGGNDAQHAVHAALFQTANPGVAPIVGPSDATRVGRDAVSNPALGFARDRFVVAWRANDGWPTSTTGQPGIFARGLALGGKKGDDVLLVDDGIAVAPSAVALNGADGVLAFVRTAPSKPTLHAAAVEGLAPDLTPLTATVVADEAQGGGPVLPIPKAAARVVRSGDGFIVAAPEPPTSPAASDGGVVVWFGVKTAAPLPAPVHHPTGEPPLLLALAALGDGSAIVAYSVIMNNCTPFQLVRITPSGAATMLPPPPCDASIGGPRVALAPLDQGFAIAWLVFSGPPGQAGAVVRVGLRDAAGAPLGGSIDYTEKLEGLYSTDGFAFGAAPDDRSLHFAWSPAGLGGLTSLRRQRLVCALPKK